MLGVPCRFDKRVHRIVHPRLERWIKRQAPGKFGASLFLYYHNLQGTFNIAHWVVPDRLFRDIVSIGYSLSNFDRAMAENFRANVRSPVSGRQLARALRQKECDRLSKKQEGVNEQRTYRNWSKSDKLTVSLAK